MQKHYEVTNKIKSTNQKQSMTGFTLVELLVVIVLIGILSTLSIVAYTGYQRRSVDTATRAAATEALNAIKIDHANANNDTYPISLADARYTTPKDMTAHYVTNADRTRFCIQIKSNNHTDIVYFVTTTMSRPQSGLCPANGY